MEPGVKLGIVYIGKAGGKHKYSLVDEKDIPLVKKFRFEARVDIDRDGNGAKIYAYAYDINKDKTRGCYFHDYIWERHCGGIAPGFKVVHKNGVTVDNRLHNLTIVTNGKRYRRLHQEKIACGSSELSGDQSLYWTAVSRLPPFEAQDEELINASYNKFYNANGDLVKEEEDSSSFFECHFAPCTRIEHELQEFSICGRCQQVRYCGTLCQQSKYLMSKKKVCGRFVWVALVEVDAVVITHYVQRDWPNHKKYCKEKARQRLHESTPDR